MFTGRLALQRGGKAIDNPVEWFDSLPEGVIEFWQAFYRHEPFGGEWHRHAEQCQMLHAIAMRFSSGDGEKLLQQADFMPADFINLQRQRRVPITEQLNAVKRAHT